MLLLAAVLAAAAWMIWHMWSIPLRTVPVQAVPAAAVVKNEPPTPVTTAPQVSPSVPAKSKPKLPFDEKSVMMPPEVRQEFDLACAVLGRAFTSGSAMALEGCVRHPEVTMPRVRALPASRGVLPVIPLEIGPKFGVTGELLLTTLRLNDGSHRPVVMEKKNGSYLLDWESLTGWCEASFTELLTRPSGKTVLLRAQCSQSSAKAPYGAEKGTALVLSHPTERSSLSAFAPESLLQATTAGKALATAHDTPFTLRVMADTEHAAQGWVRVVNVVCTGWVTDK